jgi:hypothetical protein
MSVNVDQEVLLLAGMVNGKLNNIDHMMVEKSNVAGPINKLNISALIGKAPNTSGLNPAYQGYVPEDVVRNMVPDTSNNSVSPVNVELVQQTPPPVQTSQIAIVPQVELPTTSMNKLETELIAIKSLLERINGNLTKMSGMLGKVFCSFTEKEKLNKQD